MFSELMDKSDAIIQLYLNGFFTYACNKKTKKHSNMQFVLNSQLINGAFIDRHERIRLVLSDLKKCMIQNPEIKEYYESYSKTSRLLCF